MSLHEFADPDGLAAALAAQVAAWLRQELVAGPVVLGVSGGSTPLRFFQALSMIELEWANVTVVPVDDRWVPANSPRSNAALVRAQLLQGPAAAADFLALVTDDATPEDGRDVVEAALLALNLPLAAVVLGIGTDGHTASLFPDGDNLAAALTGAHALATMHSAAAGEPRITMTLATLAAAKHIAVHIEGATKLHVLNAALQPGPVETMPIRAILLRAPEIFWCK